MPVSGKTPRAHPQAKWKCLMCLVRQRVANPFAFHASILSQKYFQPTDKIKNSDTITPLLLKQRTHHISKQYMQVQILLDKEERVKQYLTFRDTVSKIRDVVLNRTDKDKYIPKHFSRPFMNILTRKIVRKVNTKVPVCLDNKSGHSTDQEHCNSVAPRSTPARGGTVPQNEEKTSLRRLTRNLTYMVRKLDDHQEFHTSIIIDLMDGVTGHEFELTGIEPQQELKPQLQSNSISAIHPKKHSVENYDNYGFGGRKRPLQPRHANRTLEGRGSYCAKPQLIKEEYLRVQTDYDCNAIRRKKGKSRQSRHSRDRPFKLKSSLSSKKEGSSVSRSRVLLRRG